MVDVKSLCPMQTVLINLVRFRFQKPSIEGAHARFKLRIITGHMTASSLISRV